MKNAASPILLNFGSRGWIFTETEKKTIREAFLSITHKGKIKVSAPEENIVRFIDNLELLCSVKKYWFADRPKRAKIRETRQHILTDCKATLGHLKLIHQCEVDISRYDNLEYFDPEEDDPVTDFRVQSWQDAMAALHPLEKFIDTLETYHLSEEKTPGRDKADSDNFIRKIKDVYIEHIGKPTSTETGTFFKIVRVILEIFDLPFDDPSRAIRAALKNK